MSPFHHRAPGAVGAVLADDRVTALVIADGVHAHPAALRLAVRAKTPARVALATDSVAAAGLPPGLSELAGRPVVSDGQAARLRDGTLAGSTLTLDRAVANIVRLGGVTPDAAVRMASAVPAAVLGLADLGRLEAGARADVVLLDDDLGVLATFTGGVPAFDRDGRAAPLR
jgi:N-acetylglucosamine-6-phosphate deacetylase